MGIFGGNLEIDCKQSEKHGQLLCEITRGKDKAQVLGQVSKDGTFKPIREKGPMELTKILKQYMSENVEVTGKGSTDEF